ncbi:hypothetical protein K1T71_001749 [Dendrolimus kikuchii]|uniref:Uncharacterized protein n=1 Tax=Dendrolimus kikuchii TaxID=765133 RepID=A0ACC1DF13_9NEOP|nr:hypothetical protein K1T71_001749 [Dendrolimus kikuchii]
MFHRRLRNPPADLCVTVSILVKPQMRYLGLLLDRKWQFKRHFEHLAPKLVRTTGDLAKLLPNVGGPGGTAQRLYSGILRSMALYGAPVWIHALNRHNRTLLRRTQWTLAVRSNRGYRTVSWKAATFLAGDPPWELQADVLAKCRECGALDTAFHTLVECAAWQPQRFELEAIVGPIDSLRGLVKAMLHSGNPWSAVSFFCEAVMSRKEAAERVRERAAHALLGRRRQTGLRRHRATAIVRYANKWAYNLAGFNKYE